MKWKDELMREKIKVLAKKEALDFGFIKENDRIEFGIYENRIIAMRRTEYNYTHLGYLKIIDTKEGVGRFKSIIAYYNREIKNFKIMIE